MLRPAQTTMVRTVRRFLNCWRQNGVAGDKFFAYAALEPKNINHIKSAFDLFGAVYIGLALPKTIEQMEEPGSVWHVDPSYPSNPDTQPGSEGGHCVIIVG
jgi:hypothetical protein